MNNKGVDSLFHEVIHSLPISNVKFGSAGFVSSMFAHELIESFYSATHCNDVGAFFDKAVGHCGTDARGGTNKEDMSVLKRHLEMALLPAWILQRYVGCAANARWKMRAMSGRNCHFFYTRFLRNSVGFRT